MARPSEFNQETADLICELLTEGRSLRSICERDDFPACSTVCRWLSQNEGFRKQYAYAREIQADALFDETLDIADDGRNDWMTIKRGKTEVEVPNQEVISRSKLRVDTRKWYAGKLNPKKYGDKVEATVQAGDTLLDVISAIRSRSR